MISLAALTERLTALQPDLESALVHALDPGFKRVARASEHERACAFADLLELARGGDAMYDRPTVGVMYAGWYHARRMHDAVRHLAHLLLERPDDVTVIDFGAGTGAAAWACMAIERARVDLGGPHRRVRVVGLESSVPMARAGQEMWERLSESELMKGVDVAARWQLSGIHTIPDSDGWTIGFAGFLFDTSDMGRIEVLGRTLAESATAAECERLVMLTSVKKAPVLNLAARAAEATGVWAAEVAARVTGTLWRGDIDHLGTVRRGTVSPNWPPATRQQAMRPPPWNYGQVMSSVLRAIAPASNASLPLGASPSTLLLDEAQRAAARPDQRLTAVIGSAGSGKSRVLIERLFGTLASGRRGNELSVLVTTFNVDMIEQLAEWFGEGAGQLGRGVVARRQRGDITFRADGAWQVRFINWDKVPSRLFGIRTATRRSEVEAFEQRLQRTSAQEQDLIDRWEWLDASFLASELARVVYGQGAIDEEAYVACARRGRPHDIQRHHRPLIWQLLMSGRSTTYIDVRVEMLRLARLGTSQKNRFDHIFVDECQDFAPADFQVLDSLLNDPRGLVVAGDETQAMNLGVGHARPGSVRKARWRVHHLEGSYRLPIRICEAVAPLAQAILAGQVVQRGVTNGAMSDATDDDDVAATDIVLPVAVKTATLGVRPIIVCGSVSAVTNQIGEIVESYRELLTPPVALRPVATVAEHDEVMIDVVQRLKRLGVLQPDLDIERSTMRKIKGLERPLVLWSTGADIPPTGALAEWIYTILTRTTNLLVIALSQRTTDEVRQVVAQLDPNRLLFWTEEAERLFRSWP